MVEVMFKQNLYYAYISLYAGLNTVIGLQMIGSFAYMPQTDLNHFTDLLTGIVALSIGIICFVGLTIRRDKKSDTISLRRRMNELLVYVLLPLLVISLVVNLVITPILSLYIASILSIITAMVTFLLVRRRLQSLALTLTKKQ